MPWGLAEEAGKASRWLSERGLPGVELLARLLTANDGRSYASMAPVIVDGRWRAPDGELCPVCSGAAVSDRLDALVRGEEICLSRPAYPLLLVPFLDHSRRSTDTSCELRWLDVRVSVFAGSVTAKCEGEAAHLSERVDDVKVSAGARRKAPATHHPRIGGVRVPASAWRAIDALAKRTYVPATEESRARGAGAGRTDND